MPNNRQRGARFEREAAKLLTDLLGTPIRRACQSGVKAGRDCEGWEGVRIEAKKRRTIALHRWLEQAEGDADAGEVPVVIACEDRRQPTMTIRLSDLHRLCERVAAAGGKPIYPEKSSG